MASTELLIAACMLLSLLVISASLLRAWQGWLALKTRELDLRGRPAEPEGRSSEGAARIELSDLKERIRKLEAIANGVEL